MKRKISLLLALTLSFLLMFGSMAIAGECKTQIIATTSELNESELIKAQPEKTNPADSPKQAKINTQVLEEGKQISKNQRIQSCFDCGGHLAYWDVELRRCILCSQ